MAADQTPADMRAAQICAHDDGIAAESAIPVLDDMVERVARSLAAEDCESGLFDDPRFAGDHWEGYRELYRRRARRALAAALEGCEVREEWLAEVNMGGGWRLRPFAAPSRAEIEHYYGGSLVPKRFVRRYVITTSPVPAPIDGLPDLSDRTRRRLHGAGIETLEQLTRLTAQDVLDIRNSGTRTLAEVRSALAGVGRQLAGDPAATPAEEGP